LGLLSLRAADASQENSKPFNDWMPLHNSAFSRLSRFSRNQSREKEIPEDTLIVVDHTP
jgi:hypothetical protein